MSNNKQNTVYPILMIIGMWGISTSCVYGDQISSQNFEIPFSANFFQDDNDIERSVENKNQLNELKVAFVKPTFTDASYQNSFYVFFKKYAKTSEDPVVYTDLHLLKSKVPIQTKSGSHSGHHMFKLTDNIKDITDNNAKISSITDKNVHLGKIFGGNGENAYDVLILGHQEYVTQQEYDNFKKFVYNGGTIIILDGNIFYAEVNYIEHDNSITLVKGHGWEYDGTKAIKSVNERWKDETAQGVGSNYIYFKSGVYFENNPFRYIEHEEQYITNPDAIIIHDYKAVGRDQKPLPYTIATYQLNYGEGKIIAMGIYAEDLIDSNNREFMNFFNDVFLQNV